MGGFILSLQGQDAIRHGLLVHSDIVGLYGAGGTGAGGRVVVIVATTTGRHYGVIGGSGSIARSTVVPTLGGIGLVVARVPVSGHGPALMLLLLLLGVRYSYTAVYQFVLSILVVFVKVAAAVVVVIGAARIATAAAGQCHLLLRSARGIRIVSPRTGWFWLGHIIHINFQFRLL